MQTLIFLIALSFFSGAALAQKPAKSNGFKPLVNSGKSKSGFYPIEGDEPEATPAPVVQQTPQPKPKVLPEEEIEVAEAPKESTLDDFKGVTVSGIPRLIRASPETEVFFRDVNTSYIIPKDSKHNQFFEAFDQASRTNKSVSFRADPISRRVLAMDGVNGVRTPAKASAPAAPASPNGAVPPATPGSK